MNEQFETFLEKIKLTAAQREDARAKYGGVCEKLHSVYYPNLQYDGSTKLLVGSYGKHTHIRPARDIDVVFIMPPEKFQQYDDNQSNKQSQLLNDVKKILEEKYPDTPMRAFGKVVVLEFAEGSHNVEILPAWENDRGIFILPNSENGGSWEQQDYRKEIKDINESDERTGKTRSLIRMAKKWSENCTANVSSFEIEKKVLAFFVNRDYTQDEYSILLKNFFDYFHTTTNDADLKSHLATAFNRALKAVEYESNLDLASAATEWKKIFGDDFPSAATRSFAQTLSEWIAALQRKYPSAKEEYLDKKYGIPFNINPEHEVKIDVRVDQRGFMPFLLFQQFKKTGYRIYKRAKLEFSIVKNTVLPPYEVKWKVRNFGEEAKGLDALRGEITDDAGWQTKKESTLYRGEHYVQCYVIKSGQCIAEASIFVPIE